ncbi:hypothetical protein SGO26_29495 (plasmid) [Cupriavidus metallidurans]|uniref:hypothetical protein n=1 Tax=Cupriavidus metallidurans TaxID=119219 RepID=UPI003D716670
MSTQREVEFLSQGIKVRGDLVLPEGEGPFPLLVMGGGWCYVKEIVMPHYAKAIVKKGVAVLPNVSHTSLYSKQNDLTIAGALAAEFAAEQLGGSSNKKPGANA